MSVQQATQHELEVAFSGPAVASNRFFVSVTPAGVRIAFCEQGAMTVKPVFRSAVLIPIGEVKSFIEVLTSQVENSPQPANTIQ